MTAGLRKADTIEELLPDPRGRYFVGRTWLSFFADHGEFSGTIVWGAPTAEDIAIWEDCARLRLSAACTPHASLFDAGKIDHLTPTAFGALARFASKNADSLARGITRLAIVHAGSFAGAVAAGFAKLVRVRVPFEVFDRGEEALEWLGRAGDAPLLRELERRESEARPVPAVVFRLAAYLARHPTASQTEAARGLGLSTRSLQRRLAEHGTSFRRELDMARLRLAQRLLRDTNASVTEIAIDVGIASPQHLSTLFRKHGQGSPSEWRARARNGR